MATPPKHPNKHPNTQKTNTHRHRDTETQTQKHRHTHRDRETDRETQSVKRDSILWHDLSQRECVGRVIKCIQQGWKQGSKCAGVQRCQVCARFNTKTQRDSDKCISIFVATLSQRECVGRMIKHTQLFCDKRKQMCKSVTISCLCAIQHFPSSLATLWPS